MMQAKEFLVSLRREITEHHAIQHPFLKQLSQAPFTREDYKKLGLQHFALVGHFTTYMEILLLRAPHSNTKQWLAKVLVDEYGEGSEGKDHATLYREFLTFCGADSEEELRTPLHEDVVGFIREHLRLCREEPFLVGLGAVGPGHEWSLPKMFPFIVKALRRDGFAEREILYFALHLEQDIDHGLWLEEALLNLCQTREAQEQVRRGALLSLEARAKFWTGVQASVLGQNAAKKHEIPDKSRVIRDFVSKFTI